MPPRVDRRPRADADVEEAAVHLGRDDPRVAGRFCEAVHATLVVLAERPRIGSRRSFRSRALRGVRGFPVLGFGNHWIFYRPVRGGIEVLRVLHGARDVGSILDA